MKPHTNSTCERCHGTGFVPAPPSDRYPAEDVWAICPCQERERRRARLGRLMQVSGLTPEAVAAWRFSRFVPEQAVASPEARGHLAEIVADLRAYALKPRGWRVLCGAYGSGKTHLAYATGIACAQTGRAVYIASVPDLLDTLRRGYDRSGTDDDYGSRYDLLVGADLLVLDDLGAQADTPWAAEKLWQIVDRRYRAHRPLLVTTNENLYDSRCHLDPRLRSRLLDGANLLEGLTRVHLLTVGDYRQRTRR